MCSNSLLRRVFAHYPVDSTCNSALTDADDAGCHAGVYLWGAGNLVLSPGNQDDGSQRDCGHMVFWMYGSPSLC